MSGFLRIEKDGRDSKKKSLYKAFSWRLVASVTTGLLAFIVTKKPLPSLGIVAMDIPVKLLFYYVHERVWERVK